MSRSTLIQKPRPFISKGGALIIALVVAAMVGAIHHQFVSAHAGHGNEEVGEYDLDAPRIVTPETAKHIGLKVEEVDSKPLEEVLEVSGVVRPDPDRNRAIVSRVAGKLIELRVQVGSAVKKGDVIAVMDSPELAKNLYDVRKLEVEYQKLNFDVDRRLGDVQKTQAEIEALRSQADVAKRDYERALAVAGQSISQKEVESRKAESAKLDGELKVKLIDIDITRKEAANLRKQADALQISRSAMLAIYNIEPDANPDSQVGGSLTLKAESDGIVIKREAMAGSWVMPGQAIVTVADFSIVQIEGELPESLIPRVEARTVNKVRVRPISSPASVLQGTIKFIAPELEPVKRTAHLIIEVKNPNGALRGEMWVNLSIVLNEKKAALVVPKSAEIVSGPLHFVFLEIESEDLKKGTPAKYQKHDIDPGLTNDLFVEVKDGVFPGDRVVTQGAYSLTQLRPKTTSKPAATATATATAAAKPEAKKP